MNDTRMAIIEEFRAEYAKQRVELDQQPEAELRATIIAVRKNSVMRDEAKDFIVAKLVQMLAIRSHFSGNIIEN